MEKLTSHAKKSHTTRRALGFGFVALVVVTLVASAIAIAARGPACGGGYPEKWCNRPLDSVVDTWGMYNRECVSYTAYRVAHSGRHMPYGFGDANKWPAAAKAKGIAVDYSPRAGDVAIDMAGDHGHSMYVEWINDNGTLHISEYNKNKTGTYAEEDVDRMGLLFIHF